MAAMPLDEAPVLFAPSIGYYVITRYADIEQVFRNPGTYSATAPGTGPTGEPPKNSARC
jgi:hypothetical protein